MPQHEQEALVALRSPALSQGHAVGLAASAPGALEGGTSRRVRLPCGEPACRRTDPCFRFCYCLPGSSTECN